MTHKTGYGIDQALELLNQMPESKSNDEVVVNIIKKTLESTGIQIDVLLDAATQRQDEVTNEIVQIQGEIASLHQQIEEKSLLVQQHQSQLGDIGSLRERFEK